MVWRSHIHVSGSFVIIVDKENLKKSRSVTVPRSLYFQKLGKPGEAIAHYQRAAELQIHTPLLCLTSLGLAASSKIETSEYLSSVSAKLVLQRAVILDSSWLYQLEIITEAHSNVWGWLLQCCTITACFYLGSCTYVIHKFWFVNNLGKKCLFSFTEDYDGALTVLTDMAIMAQERGTASNGKPLGAFCDIMANCEITRVLLLMLLQVRSLNKRGERWRQSSQKQKHVYQATKIWK